MNVFTSLEENVKHLDNVFNKCGDIVKRKFSVGESDKTWLYIIYIDMMVSRDIVEERIIKSIMLKPQSSYDFNNVFAMLNESGIATADLKPSKNFDDINNGILSGDTILFIDGSDKAFIISTKGWPNRGVSQTETEVVVQGSKEAFNEVFRFTTTLIRRRIRDTNLKLEQFRVGRRSKTDIGVMYLQDVVRDKILQKVIDRIQNIDIDGILDCGYIEQLIEDDWMSPFPQVQVTERPDKAASAILEGRIVIVVDNSPFVLIVPVTLNSLYQASEDYYQRWQIMSMVRIIRFIAGFFALTLPALYISLAVFHPSMLPTLLTYKMAGARQTVPFPALIEILIMDFAFELLREAGIRLPGPIGNTIGIVGGIIIGQAAVEAGIVSPIVVIIVALTGISSFAIPTITLVNGYRLLKYLLILSSAILGLFGFWLGFLVILIHLVSLKSFGIPYMFPYASGDLNKYTDFKDSILRLPLFKMKKRPIFANQEQSTRQTMSNTGNKRKRE